MAKMQGFCNGKRKLQIKPEELAAKERVQAQTQLRHNANCVHEKAARLDRIKEFILTIPPQVKRPTFFLKSKKEIDRKHAKNNQVRNSMLIKLDTLRKLHARGDNCTFWSVVNSSGVISDPSIPFAVQEITDNGGGGGAAS